MPQCANACVLASLSNQANCNLHPASSPQSYSTPFQHKHSPPASTPLNTHTRATRKQSLPLLLLPPHLLVKLLVDHALCELPERGRRVAAQHLSTGGHLLLAHQVALVVTLWQHRERVNIMLDALEPSASLWSPCSAVKQPGQQPGPAPTPHSRCRPQQRAPALLLWY